MKALLAFVEGLLDFLKGGLGFIGKHWKLFAVLGLVLLAGHEKVRADAGARQVAALQAEVKIWAAAVADYKTAIAQRDAKLKAVGKAEAAARGDADHQSAGDVSAAFRRGVAAGRALAAAQTPKETAHAPPGPAAADPARPGPVPAPGGVRDYRKARAADAYRPGA